MRIALAQIVSTVDPVRNLDLVRSAAADAAAAGARLVVLPEATMCAFGVSLAPVAQPLSSNACRKSQERNGSNGASGELASASHSARSTFAKSPATEIVSASAPSMRTI